MHRQKIGRNGARWATAAAVLLTLAALPLYADLAEDITREAKADFHNLLEEPPMSIDDLRPSSVEPALADDVPALLRAAARRQARSPDEDWYIRWRLVLPLLEAPPDLMESQGAAVARLYGQLPLSMLPPPLTRQQRALMEADEKASDSRKQKAEELRSQKLAADQRVVLYNCIIRKAQEDLTRLLLRTKSPLAAREISRRLRRVLGKKDYSALDVLDVISAAANDTDAPLPPALARSLALELTRIARANDKPSTFAVYSRIEIEELEPARPEVQRVNVSETAGPLAERLKALGEAPEKPPAAGEAKPEKKEEPPPEKKKPEAGPKEEKEKKQDKEEKEEKNKPDKKDKKGVF